MARSATTRPKIKTVSFIRCAGVWILFTCAPGFFAIVRFSRLYPYDVWPSLSVVLLP